MTYRVASAHGDRVRSWAADIAGVAHPEYVWHDFAKLWQTPGEGEAYFEGLASTPLEERTPLFEAIGVPHDDALEMAAGIDETMAACILRLYRSATPNPHHHWGPWWPTRAPGLVLYPTEDVFDAEDLAAEVAKSLGARFVPIEGAGHFWPYQAPDAGAAILESFWASLRE